MVAIVVTLVLVLLLVLEISGKSRTTTRRKDEQEATSDIYEMAWLKDFSSDMTNWATWQPRVRANLLFILREEKILLIRKKRGFGAGKINGPGGKIDPGETPLQAALRETFEELGITPLDAEQRGELHFQFRDGYSLHCAVFLAHAFEGEPRETAEAVPLWTPLDQIPYDEMWADDRYWLPLLIRGACFSGWFEFDGEQLLSRNIVVRR